MNKKELLASMEQSLANKFERLYKEEKKKREEVEGENKIIKAIGNNSPEMKSLKSEVEALKSQLALDREDAQVQILRLEKRNSEHQKLNGELQVKLSKYEDKAAYYRRKAVL